ncbi:hypothetical protein [Beduinella massiliensis]|uniref:hypothetical protein n=1 Tax=Beduinella massiliensis TaxID=1852363 RepID=UPI000C8572E2
MESALKRSRFEGTLRYLWKKGWQLILVTAGVVLLMEIAVYVLAVFVEGNVNLTSVSTMFSATGVIMFILMHRAANTDARFLITRATPRLSVYGGVIAEILVISALGVIVSALLTMLDAAVVTLMAQGNPARYGISMWTMYTTARATTLGSVTQMVWQNAWYTYTSMIQWCCFYYLYFCLLRRWKVQTIAVTIGVPVACFLLMIVPAVNGFFDQISRLGEQEMWELMPQFMSIVRFMEDAATFIMKRWPTIRAISAVCCLALSYPVMAGTPQPK